MSSMEAKASNQSLINNYLTDTPFKSCVYQLFIVF